MSGTPSTRMQAAGLAAMAGLGVLGWVTGGETRADPDRTTVARPEEATAGVGAVTDESGSVRSTSRYSPASRYHDGGPRSPRAADGESSGTTGDPEHDPGGSGASDEAASGAPGDQPAPPEKIEIVVPQRVIVTMPQYRPGTPPTVNPPAASATPPAVTHSANTIVIELPHAALTPPSIEPGQSGQLQPPAVTVE